MSIGQKQDQITKLENPKFRKAFCAKAGFKFSALKSYCQGIEFITDGFSIDLDQLCEQVSKSLKDYDPDDDVIVPAGTGIVNILIGYYIANKFPDSSIAVAFFQKETTKYNRTVVEENYQFYRFYPSLSLHLWT